MSQLLHQLYAELGALLNQPQPQQQQPVQQFQQPQQQQFQQPQQQPGYPPATQEMIVALVTPLVENPTIKQALQAEMNAMGIGALPEAQPHQYPELYARFQRVQQQYSAPPQQQPIQQQPVGGGAPSII